MKLCSIERGAQILIINEIDDGENVGNDLTQIPMYGDLKGKLSKHTFIFSASKTTHYMFQMIRKPISTLLSSRVPSATGT